MPISGLNLVFELEMLLLNKTVIQRLKWFSII